MEKIADKLVYPSPGGAHGGITYREYLVSKVLSKYDAQTSLFTTAGKAEFVVNFVDAVIAKMEETSK